MGVEDGCYRWIVLLLNCCDFKQAILLLIFLLLNCFMVDSWMVHG